MRCVLADLRRKDGSWFGVWSLSGVRSLATVGFMPHSAVAVVLPNFKFLRLISFITPIKEQRTVCIKLSKVEVFIDCFMLRYSGVQLRTT